MNTNEANILPGMENEAWASWSPRPQLAPRFDREGGTLRAAADRFEALGKWQCRVRVQGGATYAFSVEYSPRDVPSVTGATHVMLSWLNGEGEPLVRDYAMPGPLTPDGWHVLSRTLDAPEDAAWLEVDLVLKWAPGGSVIWRNARLASRGAVPPRRVRLASAFSSTTGTVEGNMRNLLSVLDEVGAQAPDIICLGEKVHDAGVSLPIETLAVTDTDPVVTAIAEKARKFGTYIVVSLSERDGDLIYNTGYLFGRDGSIQGKFRKIQLPLNEVEAGVTPGSEYPVFETDFGVIGIMICWDHAFPEVARILRQKGAEILFLPTMGYTDIQTRARAIDNGVHVVVACKRYSEMPCRIITPMGDVIAAAPGGESHSDGFCVADVDLNQRHYTYWLSVGACLGEGPVVYDRERRPDVYGGISVDRA